MSEIMPDFSQTPRDVQPLGQPPKEMMSVMRDGPQSHVRINSSSLSLIQTCGRKSFYSLAQGWKSKQTSAPLVFGSAIHKAMDVFYSYGSRERTIPKDFEEYAALMAHGHAAPEQHFLYEAIAAFVKEAEPLRMLPDTDKRSISSGIWVLGHYFRTYHNDTYVIHADEAGPMVERDCTATLYEDAQLRIDLFGRLDAVFRNETTGQILPGDHKTSSQMGADFFNRIKPCHQYTGYLWLAQRCLGVIDEHFMVNGIQSKARPLTARGGPPTFTRQITRRSQEDFAEFTDVVLWAVRTYLAWETSGTWPLGTVDACASWGGCPFHDVCSAPNELRQNILEAKFNRGNS